MSPLKVEKRESLASPSRPTNKRIMWLMMAF